MIVGNYYKMLAAYAFGGGAVNATRYDGATGKSLYPYSTTDLLLKMASAPQTSMSGSAGVVFGTGDTAPSINDHCPSGDVISTISASYANSGVTNDEEYREQTVTYTVTNTGSEEITIKEVCLFVNVRTSSSGTYANFMVERTVLDKPVTISAGGVGQVTYTIRINYPTT